MFDSKFYSQISSQTYNITKSYSIINDIWEHSIDIILWQLKQYRNTKQLFAIFTT